MPEHRRETALELVYGAEFWRSRRCQTNIVDRDGSRGQVWPNSNRKSAPPGPPGFQTAPQSPLRLTCRCRLQRWTVRVRPAPGSGAPARRACERPQRYTVRKSAPRTHSCILRTDRSLFTLLLILNLILISPTWGAQATPAGQIYPPAGGALRAPVAAKVNSGPLGHSTSLYQGQFKNQHQSKMAVSSPPH